MAGRASVLFVCLEKTNSSSCPVSLTPIYSSAFGFPAWKQLVMMSSGGTAGPCEVVHKRNSPLLLSLPITWFARLISTDIYEYL